MKRISGYIVFIVCLVCISSFNISAFGQEELIITDNILEMDPDRRIIQVRDRQYFVTAVFIDDGKSVEPSAGLYYDLKVGNLVELHITGKSNGFWQAKKVIIFTEEKEEEFLKNREED